MYKHKYSSMRADIIRPYKFVIFTKFVLTYNLYGYLWANTVRPTDYTLLLLYKKLCV